MTRPPIVALSLAALAGRPARGMPRLRYALLRLIAGRLPVAINLAVAGRIENAGPGLSCRNLIRGFPALLAALVLAGCNTTEGRLELGPDGKPAALAFSSMNFASNRALVIGRDGNGGLTVNYSNAPETQLVGQAIDTLGAVAASAVAGRLPPMFAAREAEDDDPKPVVLVPVVPDGPSPATDGPSPATDPFPDSPWPASHGARGSSRGAPP